MKHRIVACVEVRPLCLLHLRIDAQELARLRVVVAADYDLPVLGQRCRPRRSTRAVRPRCGDRGLRFCPSRRSRGVEVLLARYYDPATGQFLSVDPLVPETRAAFVYAEDDPVTVTDPTGLYNCSGKSAGFLVARYQRGDARYSLVCGTSAYGVRHIQSKHFAGDLSKVLITFLIRLTISRGKPYEGSGDSTPNPYTKAYKQGFTWSSSGFPETEVFHIIAVVNTRYGRVTTAYSPESIVDQNQLDDCHFAGIDACANFGTL